MAICFRRNVAVFLVFAVLLLDGCGKVVQVHDAARTVADDLGREIKLPDGITRAVSLAPSVTEMIFAAGAGDRLVGVTTYCNYPEGAIAIEKVGDTQTPNIERIIALKPDIVFISKASQLETFMRTLEQQNVAVYVMDSKSVEDVIDDLKILGAIFGREDKSESVAADLKRRTDSVREKANGRARPKVFVQISDEPLFTVGKESFLLEIVERAGGELVTKDVPTAFPRLSKETASAMNPEVIILSDSEDNQKPNDVFKNSSAIKNGRVHHVNADILSRPGPRLVEALEKIADLIHRGN